MASHYTNSMQRRDAGIALVTVLVIVAIVSMIALDLETTQQLWFSQAQNLKDRAQAEWVSRGAQQYAALTLDRDKKENKIDDLEETWASALPPLEAEGGKVVVSIEDLQGRFNLNSLYQDGKYNAEFGAVFRRLLAQAKIDGNAQDAILDWIDADSRNRNAGAEDDYYVNLAQGYRTANQPLQTTRELTLIKGFTPEDVEKLDGLVTALPQPTRININTAPVEVLAALFDNMSVDQARQIVGYRKQHPFEDLADLKKAIPGSYKMPKDTLVTTSSEYFLVHTAVAFGRYYQQALAYLHRPADAKPSYFFYHDRPLIRIEEEKTSG